MHYRSLRYLAALIITGSLYTIYIGLGTVWFFRGLGEILLFLSPYVGLDESTGLMLADIFGQLKTATLELPLEATGVACFLLCGLFLWLEMRKKSLSAADRAKPKSGWGIGRILVTVVILLVLSLPLTGINIWFTDVNEIRFDRVMAQLVPMLESGIL